MPRAVSPRILGGGGGSRQQQHRQQYERREHQQSRGLNAHGLASFAEA